MRPDRFKKAAKVAEAAELEEERRGRGLPRRAQLHFQDAFFVGVMLWAQKEQKTGNPSAFAADLARQWNALSSEEINRGYSTAQRYW